jgi:hypothetical protein
MDWFPDTDQMIPMADRAPLPVAIWCVALALERSPASSPERW